MNRLILICIFLIAGSVAVRAQSDGPTNLHERPTAPKAYIQTGTVFQSHSIGFESGDRTISQIAIPLFVAVPVHRDVSVSLRTVYASGTLKDVGTISGIADAQLGVNYRQMFGPAELVASLGIGLPLGSAELEGDELLVAALLNRPEFAFSVPGLRQGLRFAPGFTLAVPIEQTAVFGLGISYQLRQGYKPFTGFDEQYIPGNELLLTAGLDILYGSSSRLSMDAAFVFYGTDEFAQNTLEPGSRFVGTLHVVEGIGQQQLYLRARYASRGEGMVGLDPFRADVSDEVSLHLGGNFVFPDDIGLGIALGARYLGDFEELGEATSSIPGLLALADHQLLFDLTVAPSVRVSPEVRLNGLFGYYLGLGKLADIADVTPLSGFRAQVGLAIQI